MTELQKAQQARKDWQEAVKTFMAVASDLIEFGNVMDEYLMLKRIDNGNKDSASDSGTEPDNGDSGISNNPKG